MSVYLCKILLLKPAERPVPRTKRLAPTPAHAQAKYRHRHWHRHRHTQAYGPSVLPAKVDARIARGRSILQQLGPHRVQHHRCLFCRAVELCVHEIVCTYIWIHSHTDTRIRTSFLSFIHPSFHPSIHPSIHNACMHAYVHTHTRAYLHVDEHNGGQAARFRPV